MHVQLYWMLAESVFLATFLFLLLRLRGRFGVAPLFVAVGAMQFVQVALAISLYVEILPGVVVSPGSVLLFPATLLGVLLVYVVEGAEGARRLIYGVVLANVFISLLMFSLSVHTTGPDVSVSTLPLELFALNPRVAIIGTLILLVDTIGIIVVYERLRKIGSVTLRMLVALAVVLVVDSILFQTFGISDASPLTERIVASATGKLICAVPLALTLGLCLRLFRSVKLSEPMTGVFQFLTYRQRYEKARDESFIDALTGLANRRAFDVALAASDRSPFAVLLVDIDHFKQVNDVHGHTEGDRVLLEVATAMNSVLRDGDVAYRYGGEEFCIILPGATTETGAQVASRVRSAVSSRGGESELIPVTVTIGVAASPGDGTGRELIVEADRRLYHGKRSGRDRVESQRAPDFHSPANSD